MAAADEHTVMSVGKHRGRTYRAILAEDPSYAMFTLAMRGGGTSLGRFADWVHEQLAALGGACKLPFGKHRGRTYDAVHADDPTYVDYLAKDADLKGAALHFVQWVRGVEGEDAPPSDATDDGNDSIC